MKKLGALLLSALLVVGLLGVGCGDKKKNTTNTPAPTTNTPATTN